MYHSNTTLVNVKYISIEPFLEMLVNSNTTLVNVKWSVKKIG